MSSSDSARHKTPSYVQIMMRQLRLFVYQREIINEEEVIEEERKERLSSYLNFSPNLSS